MANYPVSVAFEGEECGFNLTAILLSKIEVTTSPAKTSYRPGETLDYTGIVVTATYDDETTVDVTSSCVFTPTAGEAFESPVEIVYAEGQDEKSCSLALTEVTLIRIYIASQPTKTVYHSGETIDYAGLVVKAVYSDDSEVDITSQCSYSSEGGQAFDPDNDTSIEISYLDCSTTLSLTAIILTGISVTSNPTKTAYRSGEAIDYTGLVVTASYSDGSTVNVTSNCTITPRTGKLFDPETDTNVEISYLDSSESATASLVLTAITLTGISVTTNPTKMSYEAGEVIDYSGLVVTASYSDGSTAVVTSSCTITPRAGKLFDPDTDSTAEISYTEDGEEFTATLMLTDVYLVSIEVTTYPTKTAYKHDERIRYAGMVVTASYSDGSSNDVTSECTITPRNNKEFDEETDTNVTIEYSEGQNTATCTLSLTLISLTALQVTTNPLKMSYSSGESFDYTGIVITASYSDNTTADVTDKCTFAPSAGTKFSSGATTVTIDYTEGQNTQTCTLSLTETATELIVATMPDKTNYQPGEEMDYTGAVIKMRHLDGSTHTVTDFCDFSPSISGETITVTVKCAPPVTPYVFDQNSGYIDNGVWKVENPTRTYIDIYRVTAGHKYLLTLGITVGSRFRAMFTTTDVSQATANVTGTTIINTNSPAAYANVEYTAPSNGYIAIGKDNVGVSGIRTYLYDTDESVKTVTTEFTCNTIAVESIAVTPPVKTRYRAGETYDYAGAVVTATYTDGSLVNVTDLASFSPANGSVVDSDDPSVIVTQQVLVSFGGKYDTFNLTTEGTAILSLEVTAPPDKPVFLLGEPIDYTGLIVTAVYADGSRKDVTDKVEFSRGNGSPMRDFSIEEEYNDLTRNIPIPVEITYEETDLLLVSDLNLEEVSTEYSSGSGNWLAIGEDWSITTYEASYLDVESGEVRSFQFSTYYDGDADDYFDYDWPSDYHTIVNEWNAEMMEAYPDNYEKYLVAITSHTSRQESPGEKDRQFGIWVDTWVLHYVTHPHGKHPGWMAEGWTAAVTGGSTSFKPLLQLSYGAEASTTMNIYCKLIRSMTITQPTKASYHYGEAFDPTGITAAVTFTDGEVRDVTTEVTISPAQGTSLTKTRTGKVEYRNAFGSDYESKDFSITVITLQGLSITPPTKTSYHYGETIDYSGVRVIAVYSDDTREDVTSAVTFSPSAGTAITGDTTVNVSYTNTWNETATGSIALTLA